MKVTLLLCVIYTLKTNALSENYEPSTKKVGIKLVNGVIVRNPILEYLRRSFPKKYEKSIATKKHDPRYDGYTAFPPINQENSIQNIPDSPYFAAEINNNQQLKAKKTIEEHIRRKRSVHKSQRTVKKDDPNKPPKSQRTVKKDDPNKPPKNSFHKSQRTVKKDDPNKPPKRSVHKSQRTVKKDDPNKPPKRSFHKSQRTVKKDDPNKPPQRFSHKSQRTVKKDDPNKPPQRSSHKSQRTVKKDDPNKPPKRTVHKSQRTVKKDDPNKAKLGTLKKQSYRLDKNHKNASLHSAKTLRSHKKSRLVKRSAPRHKHHSSRKGRRVSKRRHQRSGGKHVSRHGMRKNRKRHYRHVNVGRRLIAGRDALVEDYPYMASIQKDGEHWCSGAILNERLIITTANCMWKANRVSRMKVVVGTRHLNEGGQKAKIQEVMKHPRWSIRKPPDNDIALVLLDRNLKFSDTVHGVDLPNRAMMPPFHDAWITSWGAERRDGLYEPRSLSLQVYHGHLMQAEKCNNITERFGVSVTENFLCFNQEGRKSPCTRDTGAPAVSDGVVWGLASWGIRKLCGTERFPAIFSYVASHTNMNFIANATRLLMSDQRYDPFLDHFPFERRVTQKSTMRNPLY